jgi:hypothetical protein
MVAGRMNAKHSSDDPLARLAAALESLSASQLKLADAAEMLSGIADEVPRRRLTGAAQTSRRAAREAMAAAARVAEVQGVLRLD